MNTLKSIATLLVATLIGGGLGSAQAQPPPNNPRKVVHPRSLITQVEIAEYRRAMKAAPTPEAKHELREATYARLRQRAADRGMVMAESNPWIPGMHWGETNHSNEPAHNHGESPHMMPKSP